MIKYSENKNKTNIKISILKTLIFKEVSQACPSLLTIKMETNYQKNKKKTKNFVLPNKKLG
jgi:hypothetical protein